ncbi:MAG: CDP-alcohol phosphatidyltransferase [Syntrophorhabdaceae bacterium PtaU1.Bin034]|jgi:CDP-diacylglycerol--serine O-phosphatidyltransferase|nr:MAG: CDP-alcohol phosphatidyltransferase [Syntrophorhabdaceae bacterium PtaU1.Bin034]
MRKRRGKGVYLLPNLLTSMSLFGGFYAMIATIDKKFVYASIAIFISCILDALDGRVARMTNSSSKFGVEYDSLSDVIAFGVAPGLLAYMWGLKGYGRFGWLAAFLFVACGALRLARFNVQSDNVQKKHFLGLPIPAAAATIAATVLFFGEFGISVEIKKIFMPVLVYALAFLMVSTVRYSSFKESSLFRGRHFEAVVVGVLVFVIVLIEPAITLFIMTVGYMISGPVSHLFRRKPAFEEVPHSKET